MNHHFKLEFVDSGLYFVRDIYYAKNYGKEGGGDGQLGEKNEKGKEKRRKITLKKRKRL